VGSNEAIGVTTFSLRDTMDPPAVQDLKVPLEVVVALKVRLAAVAALKVLLEVVAALEVAVAISVLLEDPDLVLKALGVPTDFLMTNLWTLPKAAKWKNLRLGM